MRIIWFEYHVEYTTGMDSPCIFSNSKHAKYHTVYSIILVEWSKINLNWLNNHFYEKLERKNIICCERFGEDKKLYNHISPHILDLYLHCLLNLYFIHWILDFKYYYYYISDAIIELKKCVLTYYLDVVF